MSAGRDRSRVPAVAGGTPVRERPLAFFRASITDEDVAAVVEALRSGWLTVGPRTEQFEGMLGDYLGVAHAVAVSSCSEAMFLSLRALGVGPGHEVVTSANTFASTVSAIIHTGATPVLADIDPVTLGPDPDDMARRVSAATGALLPVHFGGQACRIADVIDLAARHGVPVVEDAAHGFGAAVGDRLLG
ncbi:MAG: DegT/DnrJ/EryC1/StrS aminotransferase family protein, partial [Candidatus Krumholzibacteria bacterium]|nr:DegT/DnrJ/EryC1/StrS aminotransferase family protein [Candidatus Krumholzibacteria bacterium]